MQDIRQELAKDWYGQTTLHPLGVTAVIVLGLALLVVPRRYAVWPLIIMACFVAPAQRLVIASFDFDLLRLMVLFGWLRVALRCEYRTIRWSAIDSAMVAFLLVGTVTNFVLADGSVDALISRFGWVYTSAGMYFLFRMLVNDWEVVWTTILGFALIGLPVAGAFLLEQATGRNVFAVFGGVREITQVRDGRLRAQGAFAHPILAGTFWASLLPLFAAYWWRSARTRVTSVCGIVASLVIIVACASSGPLLSVTAWLTASCAYRIRRHMQAVRWSVVALLVCLHFLMNKPVWHLIARVDIVGGSTGWHRYHLIDEAIRHFPEWAAVGTLSTMNWGRHGIYDITNEYVSVGISGGAVPLALFVAVIGLSFRSIGRALTTPELSRRRVHLCWGLGASLFVHVVSFLAVSYFGQIRLVWFLTIAVAASLETFPGVSPVNARGVTKRPVRVTKVMESAAVARNACAK